MIASMVHYSAIYEVAVKYTPQSLAIGIFFFGLIFSPSYEWVRRCMEWPAITHLGRISYEIYLWHLPILAMITYLVPQRLIAIPAALAATLIISETAYCLTTKRLRSLRRRFGAHPVS